MDAYTQLAADALWLIILLSLAPLLASLIVGLIVSLLQALTQVQEQTLTFVPKMIITVIVIVLTAPFMLQILTDLMNRCFELILRISVSN